MIISNIPIYARDERVFTNVLKIILKYEARAANSCKNAGAALCFPQGWRSAPADRHHVWKKGAASALSEARAANSCKNAGSALCFPQGWRSAPAHRHILTPPSKTQKEKIVFLVITWCIWSLRHVTALQTSRTLVRRYSGPPAQDYATIHKMISSSLEVEPVRLHQVCTAPHLKSKPWGRSQKVH